MNDERLLTTRQVARLLSVTPRTVQRMVQRGDLTPLRFGPRTVRFTMADVLRRGSQNIS